MEDISVSDESNWHDNFEEFSIHFRKNSPRTREERIKAKINKDQNLIKYVDRITQGYDVMEKTIFEE